jgi:GNAT superfamily N-acetyltransferase
MPRPISPIRLSFHPLTPGRWADFESLFGSRGACGGCWCMWWRMKRAEFARKKGESNRKAMKKLVDSGEITGILAYEGRKPVGWCAVAPRSSYPMLGNSRILANVDDEPVWSVVCFFVDKARRNHGLTVRLLEAATGFARKSGGRIVEGYPVEPIKGRSPDAFVFTGLASAFRKAGFREVVRRSETRPIMRFEVRSSKNRG